MTRRRGGLAFDARPGFARVPRDREHPGTRAALVIIDRLCLPGAEDPQSHDPIQRSNDMVRADGQSHV